MRRKRDNISVKYHRQVQEDQSRKASVDFGSLGRMDVVWASSGNWTKAALATHRSPGGHFRELGREW